MIMQQIPAIPRTDGGDPSRYAQPHLSIYCILKTPSALYIASLIRLYRILPLQFQYSAIPPCHQTKHQYIHIYWWWQPLNAP